MAKIRVLIADDHAVLRAGLRLLINTQSDMEVVGEAGTFAETRVAIGKTRPDVVTLDLTMPDGTGVKLIEALSREQPQVRILVLTMHHDSAYFRLAIAAGAAGYLVKKAADSELLTAIRAVASGRSYVHVELGSTSTPTSVDVPAQHLEAANTFAKLSERERQVFELVARGHTNQAIADRLFLSVKTVESYRARLMTKLGLHNRAELTQFALELGILAAEPSQS